MITNKTVLIIGAGASVPYGFPSGPQLVEKICTGLRAGEIRENINSILSSTCYANEFDEFLNTLQKSGKLSIDAFLEHNPHFLHMGKLAIAGCLLPLEDESRLFGFEEEKWYKLLFSQLNSKYDEFSDNQLSVITFNYDRSLEHFLAVALQNSYSGKAYGDCLAKVDSLPIVHLHGSLGELPHDGVSRNGRRPYVPRTETYDLSTAAEQIRIIHEEVEKNPAFLQAKELLSSADVVAFLGFGFDPINFERLDLKNIVSERFAPGSGRHIYATTFKLGGAKRMWIDAHLYGLLEMEDCKVHDLLSDFPILVQRPSDSEIYS